MRDDVIRDYRLVTPFSTAGGGQCQWALAERGGVVYFLKRFLTPRYPVPGSPGSAATKRRKLAQCEAFEKHHRALMDALQHRCAPGRHGGYETARRLRRRPAGTTSTGHCALTTTSLDPVPLRPITCQVSCRTASPQDSFGATSMSRT